MLAVISTGFLLGFVTVTAQTAPQGQARWGPEQWAFLSVAIITSLSSAVAAIIGARRTSAVHQSLRLPSNGIDAGELLEAMAHVQHLQANVFAHYIAPEGTTPPDVPSAWEIARALRKLTDAEGSDE